MPVVLNAANEVAVASFLEGRLAFTAIPRLIERTMDAHERVDVQTLADVRLADEWARAHASSLSHAYDFKSLRLQP